MRIVCPHCRTKALITSTNELSDTAKDLYCQCTNTRHCGASFVFMLSFKHNINPPQQTTLQIAAALINSLPKDQKRMLQADMFG